MSPNRRTIPHSTFLPRTRCTPQQCHRRFRLSLTYATLPVHTRTIPGGSGSGSPLLQLLLSFLFVLNFGGELDDVAVSDLSEVSEVLFTRCAQSKPGETVFSLQRRLSAKEPCGHERKIRI